MLKHRLTRLLDSKRAIDNVTTNDARPYGDWLVDAVELLLQTELDRIK